MPRLATVELGGLVSNGLGLERKQRRYGGGILPLLAQLVQLFDLSDLEPLANPPPHFTATAASATRSSSQQQQQQQYQPVLWSPHKNANREPLIPPPLRSEDDEGGMGLLGGSPNSKGDSPNRGKPASPPAMSKYVDPLERGGAVANVDEDEDEDEEAALRRQHIRRIEVRRGIEILLGPFSC